MLGVRDDSYIPEFHAFLLDLNGQLTRRCEDEGDRTIARGKEGLSVEGRKPSVDCVKVNLEGMRRTR